MTFGFDLDLTALAAPDWQWLWRIVAFIVTWTAGLFYVQSTTLVSSQDLIARFARWAPRIRLAIDVCFTTAVTMFVPTLGLVVISLLAFFAHVGLMAYSQYFLRPLSALTLYHNWREGAKASSHAVRARIKGPALIFGSLLIIKLALLLTLPTEIGAHRTTQWVIGGLALLGYITLLIFAGWLDPLDKILTTRGIGRLGVIRGYFVTWLAEFYYLGTRQVLERAIRQRQLTSDALTSLETTIPVRSKLLIIQAESLDFNVLGCEFNGREVTPFLNDLRKRSLFYRIAAARYIGSADADFVMLNGVMPSTHIITYNIPNYPYQNTLPQFLAQFGYQTSVFHGNTGNFYNRRAAFEKMGFTKIFFEEELVGDEGLPQIAWGIEDKLVLKYSARLLREATGPVCHFIITLTTHTPYTLLDATEREINSSPQTIAHHYLNNMRYLDNQLRDYFAAIGPATVLIYSDHPADPAVAPGFKPDSRDRKEFVPCLIADTELDLGALQRTRDQDIALDGTLNLVDISSFLRAQFDARDRDRDGVVAKSELGMSIEN